MEKIHIGVDVGGTTINIGAVTPAGAVLKKKTLRTGDYLGKNEEMIQAISMGISTLLLDLSASADNVISIGLGFPGTVDSKKGIVIFAPNIFMKNVDVKSLLAQKFKCPIYLGQDSRVSAWGEYCIGQKKNVKNMASLTIGTGVGCGLIIYGLLYHGSFNTAGEFGHQLLDENGPQCNCGRKGCLEAICGGRAIVKKAQDLGLGQNLSVKDIYDLAAKGNKQALSITEMVVKSIGTGIVNMANILSLELIAISGGICNAPEYLLLNPLKKFVRDHVYPNIADKMIIMKSNLGDDAPLIGAALQCEITEFQP